MVASDRSTNFEFGLNLAKTKCGRMFIVDYPYHGALANELMGHYPDIVDKILKTGQAVKIGSDAYLFVPYTAAWYNIKSVTASRYLADFLKMDGVTVNFYLAVRTYSDFISKNARRVKIPRKSFCIGPYRMTATIKDDCVHYAAITGLTGTIGSRLECRQLPNALPTDIVSRAERIISHNLEPDALNFLKWNIGNTLLGNITPPLIHWIYGDGGEGKSVIGNVVTNCLPGLFTVLSRDYMSDKKLTVTMNDLSMILQTRGIICGETNLPSNGINESFAKMLTGNDNYTAEGLTSRIEVMALFMSNKMWYPTKSMEMKWFSRRFVAHRAKAYKGPKVSLDLSFTDSDTVEFAHSCIVTRLKHSNPPVDIAAALETMFGTKAAYHTRAVYLNEDSSFLSCLTATYSIAILSLRKIEKLIEQNSTMEVVRVRDYFASDIDERLAVDALKIGQCTTSEDGTTLDYSLTKPITVPPRTTLTVLTGLNVRLTDRSSKEYPDSKPIVIVAGDVKLDVQNEVVSIMSMEVERYINALRSRVSVMLDDKVANYLRLVPYFLPLSNIIVAQSPYERDMLPIYASAMAIDLEACNEYPPSISVLAQFICMGKQMDVSLIMNGTLLLNVYTHARPSISDKLMSKCNFSEFIQCILICNSLFNSKDTLDMTLQCRDRTATAGMKIRRISYKHPVLISRMYNFTRGADNIKPTETIRNLQQRIERETSSVLPTNRSSSYAKRLVNVPSFCLYSPEVLRVMGNNDVIAKLFMPYHHTSIEVLSKQYIELVLQASKAMSYNQQGYSGNRGSKYGQSNIDPIATANSYKMEVLRELHDENQRIAAEVDVAIKAITELRIESDDEGAKKLVTLGQLNILMGALTAATGFYSNIPGLLLESTPAIASSGNTIPPLISTADPPREPVLEFLSTNEYDDVKNTQRSPQQPADAHATVKRKFNRKSNLPQRAKPAESLLRHDKPAYDSDGRRTGNRLLRSRASANEKSQVDAEKSPLPKDKMMTSMKIQLMQR
ncbi:hypothetical protein DFJ73DRAFT_766184 [Zopfochytrium polystomum]|nr:hypothetical protein DFJ73DRAFT_766184 [Zopfochytrium polystomum]